jgi:hypothetical protein
MVKEADMTYRNTSQAKPSRSIKPQTAAPAKSSGISKADVRRSTYAPGRPVGVHARELHIKRSS